MTNPIVALIGLPNSGKSTLLNKIAAGHFAVTSDVEGTTRDRLYIDTSWNGRDFTLVDTAGLTLDPNSELEQNIMHQLEVALNEADILIWVVDGKRPVEHIPQQVSQKFRKLKKPLLLAINKGDSPKDPFNLPPLFNKLGIKPSIAISAITGRGIGDMLDEVVKILPPVADLKEEKTDRIKVSIVGKPNVGKSSLFNTIMQDNRVVVSSVPGTTRTSTDQDIDHNGAKFTFIDTAGLKKKTRGLIQPDLYSTFQTWKSARRSDICLFVVESTEHLTKIDQQIARELFDMERGMAIVVNKFDLYEGSQKELEQYVRHMVPFLWMMPIFFVSAKDNIGIHELLKALPNIQTARSMEVDPTILRREFNWISKHAPPKRLRDQRIPKIFTLEQTGTLPPTFLLTVNEPAAISMQFKKALINHLIKAFHFYGTPIKLHLTAKSGI